MIGSARLSPQLMWRGWIRWDPTTAAEDGCVAVSAPSYVTGDLAFMSVPFRPLAGALALRESEDLDPGIPVILRFRWQWISRLPLLPGPHSSGSACLEEPETHCLRERGFPGVPPVMTMPPWEVAYGNGFRKFIDANHSQDVLNMQVRGDSGLDRMGTLDPVRPGSGYGHRDLKRAAGERHVSKGHPPWTGTIPAIRISSLFGLAVLPGGERSLK